MQPEAGSAYTVYARRRSSGEWGRVSEDGQMTLNDTAYDKKKIGQFIHGYF